MLPRRLFRRVVVNGGDDATQEVMAAGLVTHVGRRNAGQATRDVGCVWVGAMQTDMAADNWGEQELASTDGDGLGVQEVEIGGGGDQGFVPAQAQERDNRCRGNAGVTGHGRDAHGAGQKRGLAMEHWGYKGVQGGHDGNVDVVDRGIGVLGEELEQGAVVAEVLAADKWLLIVKGAVDCRAAKLCVVDGEDGVDIVGTVQLIEYNRKTCKSNTDLARDALADGLGVCLAGDVDKTIFRVVGHAPDDTFKGRALAGLEEQPACARGLRKMRQ
ncbi:hypothetical protein FRC09_018368 [Ceratobasidium sp. 395]|nr:hypothetical protein FRC09_018368 [Ceratobasidium sp. 395]